MTCQAGLAEVTGASRLIESDSNLPDVSECWSLTRRDIQFFNIAPDRVAIEIKVTNASEQRSPATTAVIQGAALGAFVPWQPLAVLPVPPLAPGQSVNLRTTAKVASFEPLGSADRVPPHKLLTALGLGDEPPEQPRRARQTPAPTTMPPDLLRLLHEEATHWAGNINILIGNKDVERHQALALRVYAGRVNMAQFVVGSGDRDAYAFHLEGGAEEWQATLYDMMSSHSLVMDVSGTPALPEDRWIEFAGTHPMLLALRVPEVCSTNRIEVHVSQRSTGRTAVVEFSLDPTAKGPGCYKV